MARAAEVGARSLVAELERQLKAGDNAETAIAVYKTVEWFVAELRNVQEMALDLAEQDLRKRDLESLETPLGSAGWLEPEAEQRDRTSPAPTFFIE
jgi:hypothetical protein